MKNIKLFLLIIAIMASYSLTAQVAVTNDGSSANGSAMLDVQSTTKGFLPPRVADTNAVSSPAEGIIIYDLSSHCMRYFNGTLWSDCIGSFTPDVQTPTVYNPVTDKTWMDRNLGATQVAFSSTDAAAYGDLYQWGRASEGHESRTSGTSSINATTAVPNAGNAWDGLFVIEDPSTNDWLTPQDNTLWQGESGTNNPCPAGFRLPTEDEWEAERLSWSSNDAAGAFGSPLKLVVGGVRDYDDILLPNVTGYYWSSSVIGNSAKLIYFQSGYASIEQNHRAVGQSVRCIKD